jgi:hypothetical protein
MRDQAKIGEAGVRQRAAFRRRVVYAALVDEWSLLRIGALGHTSIPVILHEHPMVFPFLCIRVGPF